jgi:pyrroline-5-carboxylate reductase
MNAGTIWLVGCGNMGGAMLRGWLTCGIDPSLITVVDPVLSSVPAGVRLFSVLQAETAPPDTVLLAVKPQMLRDVAQDLAPLLGEETLLLSILAGVEADTIRAVLPAPRAVVRVMPNMPAAIGQGMTVLFGDGCNADERHRAEALMQPLGQCEWIEEERLFHAVTALSGSGPAFVFRFIDALAQAGAAHGLTGDQAARLALGTVLGSAQLAAASDETPAMLTERVASPGGTTRAGLDIMDTEDALVTLIQNVIDAAAGRSAELSELARG